MSNKKKIFVMVPSLQLGGQERVAVNTCEILKKQYDVALVLFDSNDMKYNATVPIIDLAAPSANSLLGKAINVCRRVARLYRIKRAENCRCVYSLGSTANIVNCLTRGSSKRCISIRGYNEANFNYFRYALYYFASDRIVCITRVMQERVHINHRRLANKTTVVYNPYDYESMIEKASEPVEDYAFEGDVIVTHGRLDRVKNYTRLIKAFSIVHKKRSNTRLLIIGEGDERSNMQALINKYGIEGFVSMIGFRNNPYKYISKATLYVLSSYNEGFPNALVEGMCFLPVVSVDCKSGPREILQENPDLTKQLQGWEIVDYGVLVEPASIGTQSPEIDNYDYALAEAILLVLENENLSQELKLKGKERVKEFSFEEYRNKLRAIIEEETQCG